MTPALTLVISAPVDAYLGQFATAPAPSGRVLVLIWFQNWYWLFLVLPFPLILLLFPTGQPPTARWRWLLAYRRYLRQEEDHQPVLTGVSGVFRPFINVLLTDCLPAGCLPAGRHAF